MGASPVLTVQEADSALCDQEAAPVAAAAGLEQDLVPVIQRTWTHPELEGDVPTREPQCVTPRIVAESCQAIGCREVRGVAGDGSVEHVALEIKVVHSNLVIEKTVHVPRAPGVVAVGNRSQDRIDDHGHLGCHGSVGVRSGQLVGRCLTGCQADPPNRLDAANVRGDGYVRSPIHLPPESRAIARHQ